MSKSQRKEIWQKILTFLGKSEEARHSTEVAKKLGITLDRAYYYLQCLAVDGLAQKKEICGKVILWQITNKGKQWLKQNSPKSTREGSGGDQERHS